ncbi:MAG: hypothetical protein ABRQ37_01255 [Candidatus Eremiobacterota bacterium]
MPIDIVALFQLDFITILSQFFKQQSITFLSVYSVRFRHLPDRMR